MVNDEEVARLHSCRLSVLMDVMDVTFALIYTLFAFDTRSLFIMKELGVENALEDKKQGAAAGKSKYKQLAMGISVFLFPELSIFWSIEGLKFGEGFF